MTGRILLVLASFLLASDVFGDCLSCWKTECVEISYIDGQKQKGYILWSDTWTAYPSEEYEGLSEFCDTIVHYFGKGNNVLILYKQIAVFDHLIPKTPLALDDMDTIDVQTIHGIRQLNNKFSGLDGAGSIPIISRAEMSIFKYKPSTIYKTAGSGLSDAYYFSYDRSIGEEEIKALIANNENPAREPMIIKIEVHYD